MNAAPMACVTVGERMPSKSKPDEPLNELMDGEERGQRREKQFAPVLHFGQCDDADGTQTCTANEVCSCGKTHGSSSPRAELHLPSKNAKYFNDSANGSK
jgi:hypothetical protein